MSKDSFKYTDFALLDDSRTVEFCYELTKDDTVHSFTETLTFPEILDVTPAILRALRALHLSLGISYYKIFIPLVIEHPYGMEETEAAFWNNVFQNGLGEFLYVNKLTKDQLAKFTAQEGDKFPETIAVSLQEKAVMGIGGGKDSVVAGELLKRIKLPVEGFVMATGEQLGQAKAVAEAMDITLHAVKRTLDPSLMNLQTQPGAYRGHVPISLIFGLVGTVVALQQKAAYVIVANEASASTPTITWQNEAVNHQWSKSFAFEVSLQNYIHQHIAKELTYFSAIRPLTSIAVAKTFAQYPQYFEVFTSDNYVFRINPAARPNARWSMESPKTLSSFILLAPWMSDKNMTRTFTQNFLDEPSLEPLLLQLTGVNGHPPLDCVGTVEELVLSLNLLARQNSYNDACLMQIAKTNGILIDDDWDEKLAAALQPTPDHAFPPLLRDKITKELA